MFILKYFYEEPASLDVLTPDADPDARRQSGPAMSLEALLGGPRYYRGYLAGTDLATGRIGLTALPAAVFVPPLIEALGDRWQRVAAPDRAETLDGDGVRGFLAAPAGTALLAAAPSPLRADLLYAAAGADRRAHLAGLRRLLDAGATVLLPEPAHHGFDWSLFAATPLRVPLFCAFRDHPPGAARRFFIPFQQARSEQKFYFEQWQLDGPLPGYIEEL